MSVVFSIIVPCFNLGEYLPEALDSVLSQSMCDWECIIVNDGSTDSTSAIASDYSSKDARFKVLNLENGGVIRARNEGVKRSSGKYLLFLDADDILMPDYLEKAFSPMEAGALIVTGPMDQFGPGARHHKIEVPQFSREMMLSRNSIHVSSVISRTDFDRAGGFNPDMAAGFEDWDLWLGVLEKDGDVVFLDSPVVRYRLRPESRNKMISDDVLKDLRHKLWEHHKVLYSKYFQNPLETLEYQRLAYSYKKVCRFPGIRLFNALRKLIR